MTRSAKNRLLLMLLMAFSYLGANGQYCLVADSTGTPLNVRAEPNGRIVRDLKNESRVMINELKPDARQRPWANIFLVSDQGPGLTTIGWVSRQLLFCGTMTGYVAADPVTRTLQVSAERDWPEFIGRAKTAIANRDQSVLENLGLVAADFEELAKNYGRGWKEMDDVLKRGYLQSMFPAEAIKYLYIDGSPCGRNGQFTFIVRHGRWRILSFGIQGCGH